MKLNHKTALVTASTRGIGYACVEALANEGATVYMAARDQKTAEEKAAALHEKGYRVEYVYNDAGKPETFVSMIREVMEREGRLDVLINNFGASDPKKDLDLLRTEASDFLSIVTINLRSVFLASQTAAKYMAETGGSIVNISSIGGIVPDISQIAYGTSKAAINYLTKLIAVQEAARGIRCNAVLPGMTATDAVKNNLSDSFRELFLRHIPLKRMSLPEEIAAAVVYFASDASASVTGQILAVSGGFGMATPVYGDLADQQNRR